MEDKITEFLQSLTEPEEIRSLRLKKGKPNLEKSIPKVDLESHISDGWVEEKELATRYRISKPKVSDALFEDEIWVLMQKLGFSTLNRDRNLRIPYEKGLTQQIDVFASDEESILIIECKAAEGEPRKSNFKTDIEAIGGRKASINAFLRKAYPSKKYKIAYIFATKNYFLSKPDKERLDHFKITHFDDETVKYYGELAKQLGSSSRYQLEANLFHGTTIHEIDNEVAAIQGKMGGHTYYAFSIEPEKLLKLGYVLHRNQANVKLMPTYQRIMKKVRLSSINSFIEAGGFFPNSIVCSIESRTPKKAFKPSSLQVKNSVTKLGVLQLPQKYRSVYIIDGQHRLYGYTGSEYARTNSIPVVAFMNLNRSDQVRLFMEINENQKAVPKNLRITLESDLYWDSEDVSKRIDALKSQIALNLGEDLESPLYGKVIVGENQKTDVTVVSLKAIIDGLSQSNFFGIYKKDQVIKDGTFTKGGNTHTFDHFMPFIFGCFSHLRDIAQSEWNRLQNEGGFLIAPVGVTASIRLFGDLVDHLISTKDINPKNMRAEDLLSEVSYYLDPLHNFFGGIDDDLRKQIRTTYGTGGPVRLLRLMQRAISEDRNEYNPDGLEDYWENESKTFNTHAFEMLRDIEGFLKSDFEERLVANYGKSWLKNIPIAVYESINNLAIKKNYDLEDGEGEVSAWDCLHLIDYRKIAIYGKNWQEIFSEKYTMPNHTKGNKEEKTKWFEKLNRIRNQNSHTYSVKKEEYEFIQEVHDWFFN
jgi:DNA sulfur modification protein DndB